MFLQENWLIWDSVRPGLLLHQSCSSQTQTTKPKLRWPPVTWSHPSTPWPTLTFWPDKLSQPFHKLQTFMNIITIPLCNVQPSKKFRFRSNKGRDSLGPRWASLSLTKGSHLLKKNFGFMKNFHKMVTPPVLYLKSLFRFLTVYFATKWKCDKAA